MQPTRIIYFDWHSQASEFYRAMPLDYIQNKQLQITRSTERTVTSHTLNPYDVVIIFRPSSQYHLSLIKLAQDLNKKVIIDWDDQPLCLPETNPMYEHYETEKQTTISCLSFANEIWVSTQAIKDAFLIYNQNIHVILNAHNDYVYKVADKKPFGIEKKVMWRGGASHTGDIYQPGICEWIVRLINKNKDCDFYWLGQKFEWIEYRVKYGNFYHHPGASTIQFYKLMHEINAQKFFYPLTDSPFNRAKSNCSWIESTYSGSAYFGQTNLHEFNKPGIFPLSDLPKMIDGQYRYVLEKAHNESWNYIKENLLLSKINRDRENRLIEIGR